MEQQGLKEALEFTAGLAREAEGARTKGGLIVAGGVVNVRGDEFFRSKDGVFLDPEHEIEKGKVNHPATCRFSTLEALVGYAKATGEGEYLHVTGPRSVYLAGARQFDKARDEFALATCDPCPFDFDKSYSPGDFYVGILAGFEPSDTTKALLNVFKEGLKIEQAREATDDGVAQEVVSRSASGLRMSTKIDPVQHLRPWRTFREIEQPESPFYFRLTNDGSDWRARLILADGGAWELEAVSGIRTTLKALVAEEGLDLPVLA